jgi:outer membrane protein, heavy metal efflux system
MMKPFSVLAALICFCCTSAFADVSFNEGALATKDISSSDAAIEGEEVSLLDYLKTASLQNRELQAAYHRWQGSISKISFSNTLPNPKVTYAHFIQEVETRVGPQKEKIGVIQKIPWLGKLFAKKKIATQEAEIARQRFLITQVGLFKKLKHVFLEYYFLHKKADIQKENILLMKFLEGVAQTRVRAGGAIADALQAQMEITSLENDLETTLERIKSLQARINAILSQDKRTPLKIPKDIFSVEERTDIRELSLEELRRHSPGAQLLSLMVDKSEGERKLAQQERFPDISIGVDWVKTDRALMATPDRGKDAVVAMITIDVPLWQSDYSEKVNMRTQQLSASKADYEQRLLFLEADLQDILFKYEDADHRMELFRESLIPQAEQTLSIVQEAYEGGKVFLERFLDVQRKMLAFHLGFERAKVDRGQRVADYEALVGALLGDKELNDEIIR